jgi:hypothetical protein
MINNYSAELKEKHHFIVRAGKREKRREEKKRQKAQVEREPQGLNDKQLQRQITWVFFLWVSFRYRPHRYTTQHKTHTHTRRHNTKKKRAG